MFWILQNPLRSSSSLLVLMSPIDSCTICIPKATRRKPVWVILPMRRQVRDCLILRYSEFFFVYTLHNSTAVTTHLHSSLLYIFTKAPLHFTVARPVQFVWALLLPPCRFGEWDTEASEGSSHCWKGSKAFNGHGLSWALGKCRRSVALPALPLVKCMITM